jgi:hypothetical protein
MLPFASPLRKSPELRRQLALVLATAEESIVQANVEEAISFLKVTKRQLSFEDALEIFFRLVGVPERIRHAIMIHTLSRLGEGSELAGLLEDVPETEPHGVRALARRLRGRRREELRNEVGKVAKGARRRIRSSYLDGAVRVVESLHGVVQPAEAVQHFIDALQIGQGWAELIFHEVMGMQWAEAGEGASTPTLELPSSTEPQGPMPTSGAPEWSESSELPDSPESRDPPAAP